MALMAVEPLLGPSLPGPDWNPSERSFAGTPKTLERQLSDVMGKSQKEHKLPDDTGNGQVADQPEDGPNAQGPAQQAARRYKAACIPCLTCRSRAGCVTDDCILHWAC